MGPASGQWISSSRRSWNQACTRTSRDWLQNDISFYDGVSLFNWQLKREMRPSQRDMDHARVQRLDNRWILLVAILNLHCIWVWDKVLSSDRTIASHVWLWQSLSNTQSSALLILEVGCVWFPGFLDWNIFCFSSYRVFLGLNQHPLWRLLKRLIYGRGLLRHRLLSCLMIWSTYGRVNHPLRSSSSSWILGIFTLAIQWLQSQELQHLYSPSQANELTTQRRVFESLVNTWLIFLKPYF